MCLSILYNYKYKTFDCEVTLLGKFQKLSLEQPLTFSEIEPVLHLVGFRNGTATRENIQQLKVDNMIQIINLVMSFINFHIN